MTGVTIPGGKREHTAMAGCVAASDKPAELRAGFWRAVSGRRSRRYEREPWRPRLRPQQKTKGKERGGQWEAGLASEE
jgi:hypothetical protein